MWGLTGFKLYAIAGLALALLISLGANRYQHGKVESLRTDLATAKANLGTAVSANESQSAAIDQCLQSNAQWMSLGKGVEALRSSLKELDQTKARVQVLTDALRRSQRDETPACLTWRNTDLGVSCPELSRRVRQLAEGSGAGPNR